MKTKTLTSKKLTDEFRCSGWIRKCLCAIDFMPKIKPLFDVIIGKVSIHLDQEK